MVSLNAKSTADLQRMLQIIGLLAVMLGLGLCLAAGHVSMVWVRPVGLILAVMGLACRLVAMVLRSRSLKTDRVEG